LLIVNQLLISKKLIFGILFILNHDTLLSWNATSIEALARTTPVNPPIVNKAKKPNVYNIGAVNLKDPP
jgi:hypothetical protein